MVAGSGGIIVSESSGVYTISHSGCECGISCVDTTSLVDNNFLVYNSDTECWEPSTNLTYSNSRLIINNPESSGVTPGLLITSARPGTVINANTYGVTGTEANTNRMIFFSAGGTPTAPSGMPDNSTIFIIRGDSYNVHGALNDLGGVDNRTIRIIGTVAGSGTDYIPSKLCFQTSSGGPNLFDNSMCLDQSGILSINNVQVSTSGHTHDISDIIDFDIVAGSGGIIVNENSGTYTISHSGCDCGISCVNTAGLVNDNFLVYNSGTDCWEPSTNLTYDDYRMTINCMCPSGTAGLNVVGDGRATLITQRSYGTDGDQNEPRPTNRLVFFSARGSQAEPSGLNPDDVIFIIRGDAHNPNGTLNELGSVENRTIRIIGSASASGTHYTGSQLQFQTSSGGSSGLFDNNLIFDDQANLLLNRSSETPNNLSYDFDQTSLRILAESFPSSGVKKPTRILLDKTSDSGTDSPNLTFLHNRGSSSSPQQLLDGNIIGIINFGTLNTVIGSGYYYSATNQYRNAGQTVCHILSRIEGDPVFNSYSPTRLIFRTSSGSGVLDNTASLRSDGTFRNNNRIVAGAGNTGVQWMSNKVTAIETYNVGDLPGTGVIYNNIQYVHGTVPSFNDNSVIRGCVSMTQTSVPSGVVNSGTMVGMDISCYRNNFPNYFDDGTFRSIFGLNINYGHQSFGSGTIPTTVSAVGLTIQPVAGRGTINNTYDILIRDTVLDIVADGNGTIREGDGTINNRVGIYQVPNNPNYFNGSIVSSSYIQSGNIKLDDNTISVENVNGGLTLRTNGPGALMVDNSGDFRGQYAVDLQKIRTAASEVSSGNYSVILGGRNNTASGNNSVSFGRDNVASSTYGVATGFGSKARLYGEQSFASGKFANAGDAQKSSFVARKYIPSGAADTILTLDGSSPNSLNVMSIPPQTVWMFNIKLTIYDVVTDGAAAYNINGAIKHTSSGTSIVGTTGFDQFVDPGLSGLVWSVSADNTYDALEININSLSGKNLRCVAVVELSQSSFGAP